MIDPKYPQLILQLSRMRPEDLLVTGNLTWLKETIFAFISNKDEPGTEFARKLEGLLRAATPSTEEQKQIFGIAIYWLLRLKIFCFWNLNQKEQIEFLQQDLVPAMKEGLDVWPGIQKYLGFFSSPEMLQELADVFLSALSANQQPVGNEAAASGEFRSTVSGWIGQYRQFLNKKYLVDAPPAGVDLVTFLNTSNSAKRLNEEERDLIKSVLSLYGSLFAVHFNAKSTIQRESGQETGPADVAPAPHPVFPSRPPASAPAAPTSPRPSAPPAFRTVPPPPSALRPIQTPSAVPRPTETPQSEQLKKIIHEANFATAPSLSGAIVNAGMPAGVEPGKMRMGKQEGPVKVSESPVKPAAPTLSPRAFVTPKASPTLPPPAVPRAPIPPKPAALSQPSRPVILSPSPSADMTRVPLVQQREPLSAPSKLPVIDLTKKPGVNLEKLYAPEELQKISLSDVKAAGFERGLNQIKQRILDLAKTQNTPASPDASQGGPVKLMANHFYRSPVYNLYVSMAVAVMNDVSGDQAAAFDKVMKTCQQSGKEFLTREEFMAINRIKKELAARN